MTDILDARTNYITDCALITNPKLKSVLTPLAKRHNRTIEAQLIYYLKRNFIYFLSNFTCTIRYRVFLNVDNNEATEILSYILFFIFNQIDGALSAKIGFDNRKDMILIYTNSRTAAERVVKRLKVYQNLAGVSAFYDDILPMTSPQILGVSIGADPPRIYMQQRSPQAVRTIQSFGEFRSDLIFQALKDSKASAEFFELIVKYFRDAGLDANDPSIQTRFHQLQWEAQRNLITNLLAEPWDFYRRI